SCHEYGRVATLLGDTSSEFRAYHRLCYTHSNDKSCGRLSYLLWMGKNPNAARKAVLHPCGGRIERACLLLASFHMQPIETPEIMNTRRLNMLGHLLDDYFHAADAVRRGGDFSGMHPDTALGIYTHRITPALQKVHQGLVADEPDRIPASPGRPAHLRPQPTAPSEVHRRYTRVVNLAYQALQQDILYLQTGRSTHRKAAQRAYSDARTEHQRAQSELRAAYALPPTGF
ncbi:MAG: hypothetical protein NDI61_12185, partial [Bdellovibrionaceae bacterium]|nr:hypothetical protein [Pseudobdellovibrionaceae bacterium]